MTLLTEEEATAKWCPFARGENWNDGRSDARSFTANRLQSGDPLSQCLCIASRCMAWRKSTDGQAEFDKYGNLPGYCGAFEKVKQ